MSLHNTSLIAQGAPLILQQHRGAFTGSIIVSEAGTASTIGTYDPDGDFGGKPIYAKVAGNGSEFTLWDPNLSEWQITNNVGAPAYVSNEDVATPDLVQNWTAINGALPLPKVEKEYVSSPPVFALSPYLLTRNFTNTPLYAPIRRTADNVEANVFVDKGAKKITLDSPISITSGSSAATKLGELVTEELAVIARTSTFDHSSWTKENVTVTSDAIADPDGGNSADLILATAVNGIHQVQASPLPEFVAGATYRAECFFKRKDHDFAYFQFSSTSPGNLLNLWVNLNTGAVGNSSGLAPTSLTATDAGDGWWQFTAIFTAIQSGAGRWRLGMSNSDPATSATFLGDGTTGTYYHAASLTRLTHSARLVTGSNQSGNGNDATQLTTSLQPLVVENGVLLDGIKFVSTQNLGGLNFAGLTSASIYAVTSSAGTKSLTTLTAQDISAVTTVTGLLAGITYDTLHTLLVYFDASNQTAIQTALNNLHSL